MDSPGHESARNEETLCPRRAGREQAGATATLGSLDDIPAPAPMPFVGWRGNLLRYLRDPIAYLFRLRRREGSLARLVGARHPPLIFRADDEPTSTVFVLSSEGAEEVLGDDEHFGYGRYRAPKGFEWINENMVAGCTREEHADRRRLIAPAFDRLHLQSYMAPIAEQTERLAERWLAGGRVELAAELYDLATRIASYCFFGQDPDSDRSRLAASVRSLSEGLMSPLASLPLNLPGTPYWRLLREAESVETQLGEVIDRERRRPERGDDVLSMMLAAQKREERPLSQEQFMADAVAIFLAGHDVPASAIVFCLLLLSQHPEVLEELHDELASEVEDRPDYFQLWKLPVLDRVVKESLRILGPTLTIFRRTEAATSIGGYRLPAGTEVLVSPFVIHHDPAIWAEPSRFAPDRWIDHRPSAFEYLPFSYGTHRCAGASFGELMMKLVVAILVRRLRLTPVAGTRIDLTSTFVISPKGKVEVDVVPQDRRFGDSRVPLRGKLGELVSFG